MAQARIAYLPIYLVCIMAKINTFLKEEYSHFEIINENDEIVCHKLLVNGWLMFKSMRLSMTPCTFVLWTKIYFLLENKYSVMEMQVLNLDSTCT